MPRYPLKKNLSFFLFNTWYFHNNFKVKKDDFFECKDWVDILNSTGKWTIPMSTSNSRPLYFFFINYCTSELKYSIKFQLSLFSTNGIPLVLAVIREVTGMLPYPSKSLQPSSLLCPPPHSCGRIHAYLNLTNSLKESSLPPVILPLHPCPFSVHSIKTWHFSRELFSLALFLALVQNL